MLLALLVVAGALAADAPVPASPLSARAAEARAVLQDILAGREFARQTGPSLAQRLATRVRAWLLDLLRSLGIGETSGRWVATTLAWGVTALALIGFLVLVIGRRWRKGASMPPRPEIPGVHQSSRDWVARAQQALAAGDAREAVRCAHMAVVLRFQEQGLWRLDEARTPREYVRLLSVSDRRRVAFHELTSEFERSWYGGWATDGARISQWLEACGCPVAAHLAT